MTQPRDMPAHGLPDSGTTRAIPVLRTSSRPATGRLGAAPQGKPPATAARTPAHSIAPPPETRKVDFCVIGAGPAARHVALKAAEAGASVILITGAEAPSGPASRVHAPLILIETANKAHQHHSGIDRPQESRLSGEDILRHIDHVGHALTAHLSDARLRALRVTIFTDTAHFEDARRLRIGNLCVVARRFVLAPQPEWDIPSVPGLGEIDYLTPDRPLVASRPVERLVVIGLSDAGLALAQAHRRLGAAVTLLPSPHDDSRMLDNEMMRLVLMGLAHDGVRIHPDAVITRIEARGREAVVHASGGNGPLSLDPAQVLLAPRLRTHFADIGWAAARIRLAGDAPTTDAAFRTSNARVAAINTAAAGDLFSFRMEADADTVIDGLLRGGRPARPVSIRAIPTSPAIAIVGLDETAARQAHGRISVMRTPYAHHLSRLARHRGHAAPAGELKVIAAKDRRIIGCEIAGDGALDIAGLWALAIARRLKLDDTGGLGFPDIARHSLTRRATRLSIIWWPRSGSLLLRLVRLWRRIRR